MNDSRTSSLTDATQSLQWGRLLTPVDRTEPLEMPLFARRTDTTHQTVVEAFKNMGWSVMQTFRAPHCTDLVVAKHGYTLSIEIKGPSGNLNPEQEERLNTWDGEIYTVRNVEDVRDLTLAVVNRAASPNPRL